MEIIRQKTVNNLGEIGQVVNVAPGYARNYLFPKKLAIKATPRNMVLLDQQESFIKAAQAKARKECTDLASQVERLSLTFARKSGENDRLFGSVTNADIAEFLKKEGIDIDKKKIILEEPIKALGVYKVPVKLHPEVTAQVKVWVVKDEPAVKKDAPPEE